MTELTLADLQEALEKARKDSGYVQNCEYHPNRQGARFGQSIVCFECAREMLHPPKSHILCKANIDREIRAGKKKREV